MKVRRLPIFCTALFALATAWSAEPAAPAAAKHPIETGPAIGWVFPLFTDKEGYRLRTFKGSMARVVNDDRIDVTDFQAIIFSGDATEQIDTILVSPQAIFYPKKNLATGDSAVRLIRDDVEVTGVGWTYDQNAKKVSLAHNVRVTFPHSQINDILK